MIDHYKMTVAHHEAGHAVIGRMDKPVAEVRVKMEELPELLTFY